MPQLSGQSYERCYCTVPEAALVSKCVEVLLGGIGSMLHGWEAYFPLSSYVSGVLKGITQSQLCAVVSVTTACRSSVRNELPFTGSLHIQIIGRDEYV
jgi:hypothetical protein